MKKSVFIALIITLVSSCSKDENVLQISQNADYFMFGAEYPMCQGDCVKYLLIVDFHLYTDIGSDHYPGSKISNVKFDNQPLSDNEYSLAVQAEVTIPPYLTDNPDSTIIVNCDYVGNCLTDFGFIHIERRENGTVTHWNISQTGDLLPVELRDYMLTLNTILGPL